MSGLLYARDIRITDIISVHVPTLREIFDAGDEYDDLICLLTATPYSMMVQLEDAKVDFTKIDDFDLFCLLFTKLQSFDTSLILKNISFSNLELGKSEDGKNIIFTDKETGAVIDRVVQRKIADAVRVAHSMERNDKRPGNEEARKYMLERARKKQKRKRKSSDSYSAQLEELIIALVNAPGFSYGYDGVLDISIYQFYASLRQTAHLIQYNHVLNGVYAGTVKFDTLRKEERTWIQHSDNRPGWL